MRSSLALVFCGTVCVVFTAAAEVVASEDGVFYVDSKPFVQIFRFPQRPSTFYDADPGPGLILKRIKMAVDMVSADEPLSPSSYSSFKNQLQSVVATTQNPAIREAARTQLLVNDYAVGNIDVEGAIEGLERLAAAAPNEAEKLYLKGMQSSLLCYSEDAVAGARLFAELDPELTPTYGFFAWTATAAYLYHITKDVTVEQLKEGKPIAEERQRMLDYMDFVMEDVVPGMQKHLQAFTPHTGEPAHTEAVDDAIVLVNSKNALMEMLDDSPPILFRMLYPDISERATDEFLPAILDLLESELVPDLAASELVADDASSVRDKITHYRDVAIPREIARRKHHIEQLILAPAALVAAENAKSLANDMVRDAEAATQEEPIELREPRPSEEADDVKAAPNAPNRSNRWFPVLSVAIFAVILSLIAYMVIRGRRSNPSRSSRK